MSVTSHKSSMSSVTERPSPVRLGSHRSSLGPKREAFRHSTSLTRSFSGETKQDAQMPSRWSFSSPSLLKKLTKGNDVDRVISQTEAIWFLTLPEKVRRQQFTREDQIMMKAKCEIALLDAPPEFQIALANFRRDSQRTLSIGSDRTSSRHSTVSLSGKSLERGQVARNASDERERVPGPPTDAVKFGQFSFLATDPSLGDRPLVTPPRNSLVGPTQPWTRSSFSSARSRSLSVTSAVSRRSGHLPKQRALPPAAIKTSPATFYRDPETRAKLRECLASPERFDQALEYGFPREGSISSATSRTPVPVLDLPSPGTRLPRSMASDQLMNIALVGEGLDDDDDDDKESISSADDMVEPSTPDFVGLSALASIGYFSESEGKWPLSRADSPRAGDFPDREMTLRMTLTKPELRASEEELYGWQDHLDERGTPADEESDPLALEALVFSDDTTGQHGAFAKTEGREKGLKAMLRTVHRN